MREHILLAQTFFFYDRGFVLPKGKRRGNEKKKHSSKLQKESIEIYWESSE